VIVTLLTDYGREGRVRGRLPRGDRRHRGPKARIIDITPRACRGTPFGRARSRCGTRSPTCRSACTLAVVDPQGGHRTACGGAPMRRRSRCSWDPTTACSASPGKRRSEWWRAVDVTRSPFRLEPVSATFHGRDVFRSRGRRASPRGRRSGRPATPSTPTSSSASSSRRRASWTAPRSRNALVIDAFGNVALNLSPHGSARHERDDRRPGGGHDRGGERHGPPSSGPSPTWTPVSCCSTRTAWGSARPGREPRPRGCDARPSFRTARSVSQSDDRPPAGSTTGTRTRPTRRARAAGRGGGPARHGS